LGVQPILKWAEDMEFFLDTVSADEVRKTLLWGVSGLTTNQTIFLQEGGVDFFYGKPPTCHTSNN